jgi:predicted nucleic acid-binding protein
MRVLIDSNILLRIDQSQHPHQEAALQATERLVTRGHEPRTVPQVFYEYWVVATRPIESNGLGFGPTETQRLLGEHDMLFPVLKDERGILALWADLVVRYGVVGKPAHDTRLVAAMLRHEISHILTFNAGDFARYAEVAAITPDALLTGASGL